MSFLSKTFKYVNDAGQSIVFDYENGFLLNLPDGVDTISVSLSTAQGVGQTGTTVRSKKIKSRPITVSGKIVGENAQKIKDRLIEVVRADIGGTLHADGWYIPVVVTTTPAIGSDKFGAKFQFGLNAPYPYWISQKERSNMLVGLRPSFKFPWNISREYRFGQKLNDRYVIVKNDGQMDIPFSVVIKANGLAENVMVENIITGEFMLLEKSLSDGETVIVDITHDRTYVTSNKDGDCRGALTLDSNLFRLHPGDNVLKPTAKSGLANTNIQVTYAEEIGGISVV